MRSGILIVDDHPGFRTQARNVLEADGFEVVGEAADGESALAAAGELNPAIVLLDVQLPDLDGFDIAKELTSNGDAPAVILISSHELADFASLVVSSGARGFIAKDELSGARLRSLLA